MTTEILSQYNPQWSLEINFSHNLLQALVALVPQTIKDAVWVSIAGNRYCTLEYMNLKENSAIKWSPLYRSLNPNVTLKYIESHREINWDWETLSTQNFITFEYIISHPEIPWDPRIYSRNQNITPKNVEEHLDIFWDYSELSRILPIEYVLAHPGMFHNHHSISQNIYLKLPDILAHPEINWEWVIISMHRNISFQEILAHPKLPWVKSCISLNPSVTMKDVEEHPEIPWDYRCLSVNPNFTMKEVQAHPERPWNLTCIQDITMDYIENSMTRDHDRYWNWFHLPNIIGKHERKNFLHQGFQRFIIPIISMIPNDLLNLIETYI